MNNVIISSRLPGRLLPGVLAMSISCGHSTMEQPLAAVPLPVAVSVVAQQRGSLARRPERPVRVIKVQLAGVPHFAVPQVELPESAGAARRINATLVRLLLTANLEDTSAASAPSAIRRAAAEYKANDRIGMYSASYEVLFNRSGLLSLVLFTEYMGAYPWTATRHATFEARTGRQLALSDLLTDTLALRRQWHQRIEARLRTYRREVAKDSTRDATDWETICTYTGWNDMTHRLRPTMRPRLGEFTLTSKGLMLYTRFWFPHAVLALAPEDDYLFAYPILAQWAVPGGALSKLKK